MTDETAPGGPDYAALAQRYLELWQEQIAKFARDPEQLTALAAAWSKMASGLAPGAGHDPHRPASAAPPPRDRGLDRSGGDDGFGALLARIDALEQRLAALESKGAKQRVAAKPAKSVARSRPANRRRRRGKKS